MYQVNPRSQARGVLSSRQVNILVLRLLSFSRYNPANAFIEDCTANEHGRPAPSCGASGFRTGAIRSRPTGSIIAGTRRSNATSPAPRRRSASCSGCSASARNSTAESASILARRPLRGGSNFAAFVFSAALWIFSPKTANTKSVKTAKPFAGAWAIRCC
jgi:hypothetical protein